MIKRIITALILIPLVLAALFYLPIQWFCGLTALVTLGAAAEWTNLMQLTTSVTRLAYVAFIAVGLLSALFIPIPVVLGVACCWWLVATLLVCIYPRASSRWATGKFYRGLMGLIVLVTCWVAINSIRNQEEGIYALLFLFVLIWGADSVAYFVGRLCGKHKLAPIVSPGKTWEGFIGALVYAALFAVFIEWLCQMPMNIWPWGIGLALITTIFSVLGDLYESMLKRQVGLKDSGKAIPGHGGLLDRIDSLTAAAPIFAFGCWLLGMYVY